MSDEMIGAQNCHDRPGVNFLQSNRRQPNHRGRPTWQRLGNIVASRNLRALRLELTDLLDPHVSVAAPTGVLARVIDELLGNALQYAKARVHVELRRSGRSAELSVADDGTGVPAEERELVFDRFSRGKGSAPGGSGLGLALVRESVTGLGGSASASESRWGGLDVVVRIPLADPEVGSESR